MLSILGPAGGLCDRASRRQLLTVGSLSFVGMSLPQLLRSQAAAGGIDSVRPGFGRADSVLMIYLQGSPSHIDLWDPKPAAPAEIRGEFRPIASRVPGMELGEVLPLLAGEADKFTLVRSCGVKPKGLRNHGSSIYMLLTGHDPGNFSPTGLAVPPSREDLPSVGSVVSRYRPSPHGGFGYVSLCGPVREGAVTGVGQAAGLLGAACDPFTMYDDPTAPLKLDALTLQAGVSSDRLQQRVDLRRAITEQLARTQSPNRQLSFDSLPPTSDSTQSFDAYYGQALSLIQQDRAVRAFRLEEESANLRDAYGRTRFGQSCLLARRLIEAGTRFVQVTWPAGSDTEPVGGPDGSWDTHRNNFPMLRDHRCPVFDRTMSTLLSDMHSRGLLDRTLVVAVGEFGRSPQIGVATTDNVGPGGRDHWPECYTFLITGGGVKPGRVYGESDRYGAFPKTDPVHPYDLICTIHHALGIDPATEYRDTLNRPRRLTDHGEPILGLFA
jgi:hypothetical protein